MTIQVIRSNRGVVFGAASIAIGVIALAYSIFRLSNLPPSCAEAASASCGGFTLWLWSGAGAIVVGLLAVAISRRMRGLIVGALAVALACAGFVVTREVTNNGGTVDAPQPAVASAPSTDAPVASSDVSASGSEAAPLRHPFPEIPRTRSGLPLEDDPFVAASVEEQRWLDRNGYPTLQSWMALQEASDLQLEQAALAGDRSAAALLQHRRLVSGSAESAEQLLQMGAGGNTFALELLASAMAGPLRDPAGAYAISRVAELRGNARIGFGRDLMFDKPLTPAQRVEAEQEAARIYSDLLRVQRSIRGPNSPAVDPRPIDGPLPDDAG